MNIEKKDIFLNNESRIIFLKEIIELINLPDIFIKNNTIYYSKEYISIDELSKVLKKSTAHIISFFWSIGEKITKNHNLSEDLLSKYAEYIKLKIYKFEPNFNNIINSYINEIINNKDNKDILKWELRPTVISVMGHIDHGKTTLVSTIRGVSQEKEFGGITQNISSFVISSNDSKFIILDTPGHSDFIRLRYRGISLTDVVILVIDSNNGVAEQTKEIINYLKTYSIPTIVFVNFKKKDNDYETNLDNIKLQLQNDGITTVDWGGTALLIYGSAKDPNSAKEIIEIIFNFYNDNKSVINIPMLGVVIDSFLKSNIKFSKILIQHGILRFNDYIFFNGKVGKIKNILSTQNKQLLEAFPGDIVFIAGSDFSELGEKIISITKDEFNVLEKNIKLKQQNRLFSTSFLEEKSNNIFFFILSNTENNLKSLIQFILKSKKDDVNIRVIGSSVGQITDNDLNMLNITSSKLLCFETDINSSQKMFLKEKKIDFFKINTIYQLIDIMEEIFLNIEKNKKQTTVEEEVGRSKVIVVYKFSKGNIAGCYVESGNITRSGSTSLIRDGKKIYEGKIKSLQVERNDVKEVKAGKECGIILDRYNDYQEGDIIISYKLIRE